MINAPSGTPTTLYPPLDPWYERTQRSFALWQVRSEVELIKVRLDVCLEV